VEYIPTTQTQLHILLCIPDLYNLFRLDKVRFCQELVKSKSLSQECNRKMLTGMVFSGINRHVKLCKIVSNSLVLQKIRSLCDTSVLANHHWDKPCLAFRSPVVCSSLGSYSSPRYIITGANHAWRSDHQWCAAA